MEHFTLYSWFYIWHPDCNSFVWRYTLIETPMSIQSNIDAKKSVAVQSSDKRYSSPIQAARFRPTLWILSTINCKDVIIECKMNASLLLLPFLMLPVGIDVIVCEWSLQISSQWAMNESKCCNIITRVHLHKIENGIKILK